MKHFGIKKPKEIKWVYLSFLSYCISISVGNLLSFIRGIQGTIFLHHLLTKFALQKLLEAYFKILILFHLDRLLAQSPVTDQISDNITIVGSGLSKRSSGINTQVSISRFDGFDRESTDSSARAVVTTSSIRSGLSWSRYFSYANWGIKGNCVLSDEVFRNKLELRTLAIVHLRCCERRNYLPRRY